MTERWRRKAARALASLCWLALCLLPSVAPAQTAPPTLVLEALPVLGSGLSGGEAWFDCVLRVYNAGDAQVEGDLELVAQHPWSGDAGKVVARAPFAVVGKARVLVQLPIHGFNTAPPRLSARALGPKGDVLATVEIPEPAAMSPMLFDLNVPSRIAPGLRGQRVAIDAGTSRGTYGAPVLALSQPQTNPATGEPVLPERASGYAAATVVLAKSEQVTRLKGPELDALGTWVLSGGALALVISRPEDLRHPTLKAFVGGELKSAAASSAIKTRSEFLVAPDPSAGGSYGSGYGSLARKAVTAPDAVLETLVGYTGGNLRATPFGASAGYGLGEVHLLAFDATRDPLASEEWVQLTMLDLLRHASERRATIALPHAATPLDAPQTSAVRKQLDPNEGARWAVAVALLILLIYAVLAGPLNFYLASKKGRPLRALVHLPIWAGATMAVIVALGAVAKGVFGRARRIALVEAGAGMPRAAITRYRGFYASSTEELVVRATERGSVLDIAGEADEGSRVLVVDRDGARLEQFRVKPWQTVVVREDGFVSLGGGVSLVDLGGGDVGIKNRAARDLVAVLVKLPSGDAYFHPRIGDGHSVTAKAGTALPRKIGRLTIGGHGMRAHRLDSKIFGPTLEPEAKGVSGAWSALESIAGTEVDWWPDDVPVLIGQLEGGEGKVSDSGLDVDIDRVLVRVVGYGGVR